MASFNSRIAFDLESIERENIEEVFKSTLLNRKHAGPKQVFSEIKNVIHNQNILTPFKSNAQPIKTPLKSNAQPIKTPLKSNMQLFETSLNSNLPPFTSLKARRLFKPNSKQLIKESKPVKTGSHASSKTVEKKGEKEIRDMPHNFTKNPPSKISDPLFYWSQEISLNDDEINRIIYGKNNKFQKRKPNMPVEPFFNIWTDHEQKEEDSLFASSLETDQIVPVGTPELPDYSNDDELFNDLLTYE